VIYKCFDVLLTCLITYVAYSTNACTFRAIKRQKLIIKITLEGMRRSSDEEDEVREVSLYISLLRCNYLTNKGRMLSHQSSIRLPCPVSA